MRKIKMNTKTLFESNELVDGISNEVMDQMCDMVKSIINGKTSADVTIDNVIKLGNQRNDNPNISKIDSLNVYSKFTGKMVNICPSRLVALTKVRINELKHNTTLGINVVADYFQNEIIWTFKIDTAATDGIRIFMNPIFVDHLFTLDKGSGKLVQYVYIHEIYHQLYQHRRRAEMKSETAGGKGGDLTNISMDCEINEAIERQFKDLFEGCTAMVKGCMAKPGEFGIGETWENIFDAYASGEKQPPMTAGTPGGQGQNPRLKPKKNNQQGQQGQGQPGSGQPGQGQQGGQSGQDNSGEGKIDWSKFHPSYKEGWKKAIEDWKAGKLQITAFKVYNMSTSTNSQAFDQEEYDNGYEDAIEFIKAAMEQQSNGNNGEPIDNTSGENGDYDHEADLNGEDFEDGLEIPGDYTTFGPDDQISPEEGEAIAAESGQPYGSEDVIIDPVEWSEKKKEALKNVGRSADGHSLGRALGDIKAMFAPKINWKSKLRRFFTDIAVAGKEDIRPRKFQSTNLDVKYARIRDRKFENPVSAPQVLHLVDGSGSMGSKHGDNFKQIFSEIINIQQSCKIKLSQLAWYAAGKITKEQLNACRWKNTTSKAEVLRLIANAPTADGGTSIATALKSVIDLGSHYFRKNTPTTLTIVYTDGYDNFSELRNLPYSVLRKLVVFIINESDRDAENTRKELIELGLPETCVFCINSNNL